MKYLIAGFVMFFAAQSFAGELEGADAKNVIMNGEVMGAQLLDERYSKLLDVQAGTFFSVKLDGAIYNCFYTFPGGYFCESLD